MKILNLALVSAALLFSTNALSTTISWVDWETISGTSANGQAVVGSDIISVSETSTANDQSNAGTGFWTGNAFTFDSVDNAPTTDMIRLSTGGQVTLNFNTTVTDVYIALVSWNAGASAANFSGPVEIVSNGTGFFGSGNPTVTPAGDGFTSTGEVHGILKLVGDYSSFSFTHGTEFWHGFTIGFAPQQATPQVSAPSVLALVFMGLVAVFMRKKNQK